MGERRDTASSHKRPAGEPALEADTGERATTPAPEPAPESGSAPAAAPAAASAASLLAASTETAPRSDRAERARGDLAPGTPVGEYVLGEWIARGGFGDVYRAACATRPAPSAVKVLHADLASTRAAILRFEREIEAIQRAVHPNVIAIEGFGQLADGRPWFAMPLLSGVDLGSRLTTSGRLAPRDALAILEPLAAALDAVHARGIVHRDLKPSNVFLDERDGARHVVLLDFGVAKLLDDSGPGLTASLQLIGTPAFMAPEQILGKGADARTDVYALGALLHAMLTGAAPFSDSGDALGQLQLHLHTRPPRVSSRAPVDPAFDDVVLRAMSKQPEKRQASAGELLEDFRHVLGAQTGEVRVARRAAAVYVAVRADDASLDEPDDRLLADLDALLPLAGAMLTGRGLRLALEMGNAALFLLDLPDDAAAEQAARKDLVAAARDLYADLIERPGRDARIELAVFLHAGPLLADEHGAAGPLLDVAAWVPDPAPAGLLASNAMLAGIGREASEASPASDATDGNATEALVRLEGPPSS